MPDDVQDYEAFFAKMTTDDAPEAVAVEDAPPAEADTTPAETDASDDTAETEAAASVAAEPTDDAVEDDDPAPLKMTFDEAFAAEMQASGVKLTIDDIAADARPLVEKKLKDLEAGFTRTMQRVREDARDGVNLRAELRHLNEQPADYIVSLLLKSPSLAEAINERLGEVEQSSKGREYFERDVTDARSKARDAEQAMIDAQTQDAARANALDGIARAAARAAGVPFKLVEGAVAAHLAVHGDTGAATETDIRQIAQDTGAVYTQSIRARARTTSQQTLKAKLTDKRSAPPRATAGGSTAPGPGAKPTARSDAEFIAQMVNQL